MKIETHRTSEDRANKALGVLLEETYNQFTEQIIWMPLNYMRAAHVRRKWYRITNLGTNTS